MIRRIKIKNFESHEDSEFEFSGGLNYLKGDSDSGKSSVLRALCVAAQNLWDEDMIRVGAKFSEIEVESDKGTVKTIRGSGKNEWEVTYKDEDGLLKKEEYNSIGKTVPDKVVQILGMPKIKLGDVSDLPNVMFQLEKHFMLSEVNGKKCTPNMIAQMIDNIAGLEGIEDLIKKMSVDGTRSKKKITENNGRIKKFAEKLHDDEVIERKKTFVEKCDDLIVRCEEKQNLKEKAEKFACDFSALNVKIKAINSRVAKLDMTEAQKKIKVANKKVDLYKRGMELIEKFDLVRRKLESITGKIKKLPNNEEVKKIFPVLVAHCERLQKLESAKEKFDKLSLRKFNYEGELKSVTEELEKTVKARDKLVEENPNCPLCGHLLEESELMKIKVEV